MNVGKTLFAQVMEFVPWTSFGRIVDRHGGNAGVRRMSCAEQFRVMAFAQLTWRESLRDIEATLGANANKLYAMGLRHSVHRSTLADANESRDWRIWSDLAAVLIPMRTTPLITCPKLASGKLQKVVIILMLALATRRQAHSEFARLALSKQTFCRRQNSHPGYSVATQI